MNMSALLKFMRFVIQAGVTMDAGSEMQVRVSLA